MIMKIIMIMINRKIPAKALFEPRIFRSRGGRLNH